jgi:hypothetical protein
MWVYEQDDSNFKGLNDGKILMQGDSSKFQGGIWS